MEFVILDSSTSVNMERIVRKHIRLGWEFQGSMFLKDHDGYLRFYQPMIKKEEKILKIKENYEI